LRAEEIPGEPLVLDVRSRVLPEGYELVPGLNSIYELDLALAEASALSKNDAIRRSAYFARIDGRETVHYKLCSGSPLQVDQGSFRMRAFFEVFKFKTSYATHGLFPYRGKFHPQLIKAIMNIIGLKPGDIVLDPMTGSGTTNIEASVIGINSIGFDMNPFAVFMARAKTEGLFLTEKQLPDLESTAMSAYETLSDQDNGLIKGNEKRKQLNRNDIHSIILLCYLDAVGYSARVKTKKLPELFPIVLQRYMTALRNFVQVRDELDLRLGDAKIEQADARDMSAIASDSVDGIVTSPPYSFAIDYLKGDAPQLQYLGYDVKSLRETMIGLRGTGLKNQVYSYAEDMNRALGEMARVLKSEHHAVVIIGSNTVQLEKVLNATGLRLEDELVKLGEKHGLHLVQRFERPIEGIQNVMRSEHILFMKKQL
jgi:SAM-dependent methyltransferase